MIQNKSLRWIKRLGDEIKLLDIVVRQSFSSIHWRDGIVSDRRMDHVGSSQNLVWRSGRIRRRELRIHASYCFCKISLGLGSLYLPFHNNRVSFLVNTKQNNYSKLLCRFTLNVGVNKPFSRVNGSSTKVTAFTNSNPLNCVQKQH